MARVSLDRVSFSFPVFELTGRSLKVAVMRQMAGGNLSAASRGVVVTAVKDVSFTLRPGDRLGLIGHNGAGKSSLLRILAGLASPTSGTLEVEGRVVPLIEKGLGINPELSGLANIELPLRLLGATNGEIRAAKEEIPDWTGLGQFINLPFRTYSEGMKARLSFALSTSIDADILLLDEWLGAGDAAFVHQAQARLSAYLERAKVLVFTSHSLELIRSFCNVVLWMERGQVVLMGAPDLVIDAYSDYAARKIAAE